MTTNLDSQKYLFAKTLLAQNLILITRLKHYGLISQNDIEVMFPEVDNQELVDCMQYIEDGATLHAKNAIGESND